MAVPITLKEFLEITYNPKKHAERQRIFSNWYESGIAEKLFAKTDILTTDSNIRQVVYGAPLMSWLNYESNLWALLPKRPAGPRTGWRVLLTGRTRSSGLQETANPMATSKATFQQLYYVMKWMDITYGASEKVLWQAERDDALDVWGAYRDHFGQRHVQSIDEWLAFDPSALTQSTWVIASLQQMVSSSSEATFIRLVTGNASRGDGESGATACDVYPTAGDYQRKAYAGTGYGNGPFDSVVDVNPGGAVAPVLRPFDLTILDAAIRTVFLNGATREGLIMVTGPDTADVISQKVEAKQRFTQTARVVKGLNGVQRVSPTGVDAGFEVLSYKDIPIFTSKAIYNQRPSGGISNILGLHIPNIYISLGMPTLYLETGRQDWLLLDKLRRKAGYFTAAELVFERFNTHFKIRDLSG